MKLNHLITILQGHISWRRHQMEAFSMLLALCAGNAPVSGEFPSQRPVTRSFDIFFDRRLNKRLSKESRRRWHKRHRAYYDVTVMSRQLSQIEQVGRNHCNMGSATVTLVVPRRGHFMLYCVASQRKCIRNHDEKIWNIWNNFYTIWGSPIINLH